MSKVSKIIIITLLLIICFISFSNIYAIDDPGYYQPPDVDNYSKLTDKGGIVLGTVRNIGAIVSVLGIAVLGIRYMLGSLEEKANYKETMLPFIIGIAMTVGATAIITIVQNIAK